MDIHLDLSSGIAGDMFLAACLDLGLSESDLRAALSTLPLPGWSLETRPGKRGGLRGLQVIVTAPEEHTHRHLSHILAIIDRSELPQAVRERAGQIFRLLAEAEGVVHGIAPAEVHFHEVGAVDAIIDICGAAYAAWKLSFAQVSATAAVTGSGWVNGTHGRLPVPAPAVAELLRRFRVPLQPETVSGELMTPTGTAILVALAERFGPSPLTRIDRIGVGLGGRETPGRSNALRILAQENEAEEDGPQRERVGVVTTHIDDMNPEWYGLLWERLFAAGALDVALTPIIMKKGRPAARLEVITPPGEEERLARLILNESTALGVRLSQMERLILPRRHQSRATPWGEVRLVTAAGIERMEYEDIAAIARQQGWSLPQTQAQIQRHWAEQIQHEQTESTKMVR